MVVSIIMKRKDKPMVYLTVTLLYGKVGYLEKLRTVLPLPIRKVLIPNEIEKTTLMGRLHSIAIWLQWPRLHLAPRLFAMMRLMIWLITRTKRKYVPYEQKRFLFHVLPAFEIVNGKAGIACVVRQLIMGGLKLLFHHFITYGIE